MKPFEGLFTTTSHVTLDDGGIRARSSEGRGQYVPFTAVRDARVDFGLFGVALLRLACADRTLTLRVQHDEALFVHAEITPHLGELARAVDVPAALVRDAKPLGAWLEDVATWAVSSSGYRTAALDRATATAIFEDARVPAEQRAAMVHAMLATGDEEELATVARAFVQRALPPLVILAARLGRGGAALVPDAMFEEALAYVSPADAQHAEHTLGQRITHENEAHIHELMERVKTAALAQDVARRSLEAHRAPKKRHHASALGGYASSQGVTRFK